MKLLLPGIRLIGSVICATLLVHLPLHAQLALQTTGQGSYAFNSGYPLTPALHQPTLFSLFQSPAASAERNITAGYVIFKLPQFTGSIAAATLTLDYSGAFRSGGGTAPIGVNAWDVQTPVAQLTNGPFNVPVASDPAFDLQSGALYASGEVDPGVFQMKTLSLSLNTPFLNQANALSGGGTLAIGLALAPPPGLDEYSLQLLTAQAGDAHVQLQLRFTPVPEASTFGVGGVLLIAGLITRRWIRRR